MQTRVSHPYEFTSVGESVRLMKSEQLAMMGGAGSGRNMSANSDLIDAEIAAWRDRDLDRYLSFFAPDVIVTDFDGNVLMNGLDALRENYGPLFRDSPSISVDIRSRSEVSDFVIDTEHLEGLVSPTLPPVLDAGCVYRIKDGKIAAMKFLM